MRKTLEAQHDVLLGIGRLHNLGKSNCVKRNLYILKDELWPSGIMQDQKGDFSTSQLTVYIDSPSHISSASSTRRSPRSQQELTTPGELSELSSICSLQTLFRQHSLAVFSCSVSLLNLLDALEFTGGSAVAMGICCLLRCEFREGWGQPSTDRLQRPMVAVKPPHPTPEDSYRIGLRLARSESKVLYTRGPFANSQALGVE